MPIYEYKCNSCGEVQEVLHKSMGKIESVKCSSCGSDDLTRLISVASVSMGGSSSSKGLTCCGRDPGLFPIVFMRSACRCLIHLSSTASDFLAAETAWRSW